MFLPWYGETATVVLGAGAHSRLSASQTALSAVQAFSFVHAAVLLVGVAVLVTLYARADGQPFRLPGGDGLVVIAAGTWAALMIFYSMLEKPGLHATRSVSTSTGLEWGIFVAFACALLVAAAGARMRAAQVPEAPALRPRSEPPPRPRYPPAPSVSPERGS